jgi:hypothetical protein
MLRGRSAGSPASTRGGAAAAGQAASASISAARSCAPAFVPHQHKAAARDHRRPEQRLAVGELHLGPVAAAHIEDAACDGHLAKAHIERKSAVADVARAKVGAGLGHQVGVFGGVLVAEQEGLHLAARLA